MGTLNGSSGCDKVKKETISFVKKFIIPYSLITIGVSLAAAGLYGRIFRLEALYQQPGDPGLVDYIFEGLHIYFIMQYIFLIGSTIFFALYKKKKLMFFLGWVLFNIALTALGLFVCVSGLW